MKTQKTNENGNNGNNGNDQPSGSGKTQFSKKAAAVINTKFFKKALITTGIILVVGGFTWLGNKGWKSYSDLVTKVDKIDANMGFVLQNTCSTAAGVTNANSKLDDITPIIKDIKARVVSIDKKAGEVTIHLDRNEMAQLEVTVVEEKNPSLISRTVSKIWPFGKSKTKKVEKKVNNVSYKVTTNETVKAVSAVKSPVPSPKPIMIEPKKKEEVKITPPKAKEEVKITKPKIKKELKKEAEKKKKDEVKIKQEIKEMVDRDRQLLK